MERSVYDLAFNFIEEFYGERECPPDIKKKILRFMRDLLFDGFTSEEITMIWKEHHKKNPGQMPKLEKLYSRRNKETNLLDPDRFYYHNHLMITPGPPVRDIDYNTGEITKTEEDFFLEMRASLTISQLVAYYAEQFDIKIGSNERRRLEGSFRYILKEHKIEEVLFMIDVASNLAYAEDWKTVEPIKLPEYKREAMEARAAKMTELREAGDDYIVPRKRVLSSRRRRKEA